MNRERLQSGSLLVSLAGTGTIVVLIVAFWYVGSTLDWWREAILPDPGSVASAIGDLVRTGDFWSALGATIAATVISFITGSVAGLLGGALLWRLPLLGRILEPYVVSFYAVPIIVLYPVMLVLVGINIWSLVIMNTLVIAIPVLLNTWVGFQSVGTVLFRLAASLRCTAWQRYTKVMIPAALPQIVAGLRLGASLAIVGITSMEFLLAPAGLGYEVRYAYEGFEQGTMWGYVVVIFVLASVLMAVASYVDDRVQRGRR
jgi:NitT/TauT family transport system permease protein